MKKFMENKIDDFKKYYLATQTPMSSQEGFDDVLARIEKDSQTPLLRFRFLYIGISILVLAALVSSIFILPENNTTQALKNAPARLYNSLFTPSAPPIDLGTEKINAKPTLLPSPTTTTTPKSSEKRPDVITPHISEIKKPQGNSNSENVKGVSDEKKPENIDFQFPEQVSDNASNNSEKRNENSYNDKVQNQGNSNNPAQEKSNGKAQNN